MSITEKELEHLAVLSKLKLSPEEKKKFLNNMDSIINFLDQLKTSHVNTTTEEQKLRCFSKWNDFSTPKKLLENSTH